MVATKVLIGVALSLGAISCSESSEAASDSPYIETFKSYLLQEGSSFSFASEKEATCYAEKVVERVGEDRLKEIGVLPGDASSIEAVQFSENENQIMFASVTECITLPDDE